MDASLVKHHVDQIVGALADVAGTIKFCEDQIWQASCDDSMKPETETKLNSAARALSLIARLIDWEVEEMERIGSLARKEIEKAERRCGS